MSEQPNTDPAQTRSARELTRPETPIVPRNSVAGQALIVVIAIMTFLASLTTGAVVMVRTAASEWQSDVTREVTVQVRPVPGRNLEADVNAAVGIVRATPGIADVRAYSKEESADLLEPWLGQGLVLDDLPLPRLIVVRIADGATPDFQKLGGSLSSVAPSASLDDHRRWVGRMRTMAGTAVFGGMLILALMIVATGLTVAFATRGVMAANRSIVEVLHFIGARNRFIAGRFQRHFLRLGLQGGLIGGGAAILMFLLAQAFSALFSGTAAEDQLSVLFGRFSLGLFGYVAVAAQILLVAAVTAVTSRHTVNRTLETVD